MVKREIKIEAPELRLDPERLLADVEWAEIFGNSAPVEIEIGIGKGRFLLAAAAARPAVNRLGIEWANKYLRIAESRALARELESVRFVRVDARELICGPVPDSSVSAYYIFYPDPWPKKRHHKRRFLQREPVGNLARTLVSNGWLHVATDHDEYWESIERLLDGHAAFQRQPSFGGTDFPLPLDAPLSNYEEKYRLEGRSRNRGSWRRHRRVTPDP